MDKRASLSRACPEPQNLDAKTCLSKVLYPHPCSRPRQSRATSGTSHRVHVLMWQGSPHPVSHGELDGLLCLQTRFEPPGCAVSVHTLTDCEGDMQ